MTRVSSSSVINEQGIRLRGTKSHLPQNAIHNLTPVIVLQYVKQS